MHRRDVAETRIGGEIGSPDCRDQLAPVAHHLQHHEMHDATILRAVAICQWVGRIDASEPGFRQIGEHLVGDDVRRHHPHAEGHERDVDDRCLARSLTTEQRRRHPAGDGLRTREVTERRCLHGTEDVTWHLRHRIGHARARPERRAVVATLVGVGPASSLARTADVDDRGVHRTNVVDVETGTRTGTG